MDANCVRGTPFAWRYWLFALVYNYPRPVIDLWQRRNTRPSRTVPHFTESTICRVYCGTYRVVYCYEFVDNNIGYTRLDCSSGLNTIGRRAVVTKEARVGI